MPTTPLSDQGYRLQAPDQLFPLTQHFSYWLTPLLARTALTPNQITALSLLAGLAGAWCFMAGTWIAGIIGASLLVLGYTLDNCDGEIARLKNLSSEWGAHFDNAVDWLVDAAFFAGLGYGTWTVTGEVIWLWLGLAATGGATVDYVIDVVLDAREKKDSPVTMRDEEVGKPQQPEESREWPIYVFIFHKLSRADFCVIVFILAMLDWVWVLLPLGAIGAQAYWITDLFKRARGWRAYKH